MEKSEIRKKILKYKRDVKILRAINVENCNMKAKQLKDIEVIKEKIEKLRKELNK